MKRTLHRHESASPIQARNIFRNRFAPDATSALAARVKTERGEVAFECRLKAKKS